MFSKIIKEGKKCYHAKCNCCDCEFIFDEEWLMANSDIDNPEACGELYEAITNSHKFKNNIYYKITCPWCKEKTLWANGPVAKELTDN